MKTLLTERERLCFWQLHGAIVLLGLCTVGTLAQHSERGFTNGDATHFVVGKTESANQAVRSQSNTEPDPDLAHADPIKLLRAARVIYVRSSSLLVKASVVEEKLRERREFQELGLLITREPSDAELILELRHDLLTKYVFSAIDRKTQIVVASGKLSSLGGTVAGKVARRFLSQVGKARAQAEKTP